MKTKLLIGAAIAMFALAGCGNKTAVDDTVARTAAIEASMTHADRPEKSRENDVIRKAKDVALFTGIKTGDTVVELEAGDGFYTEIFSRLVGVNGHVTLQNPPEFDGFLSAEVFTTLLGDDGARLANVTHSKSSFADLAAKDASTDVVTWFLGPHELWYKGQDGKADFGNPEAAFAEISRVLKPGGTFIALDHVAPAGSPASTGGTTHRIDPAIVRKGAEAAGLVFVKESDILANPDDKYDVMVFSPDVRRKTDRFLHMYRKPG